MEALIANRGQLFDLGKVLLLARETQIRQRNGIEIVVGQGDKPEAETTQAYDLIDHLLKRTLPRLLPIGTPDAAEGAVLGASANGLHRGPHIFVGPHQIPSRRKKLRALDPSALIDLLGRPGHAIRHRPAPGDIAISLDHRMRFAALQCFFGKERGVNSAIHDPCPASPRHAPDLVAAQGIARVHADANNVARLNALRHNLFERFVYQDRGTGRCRRCRRKHEQPARCDNRCTKGIVTGIDQMNARKGPAFRNAISVGGFREKQGDPPMCGLHPGREPYVCGQLCRPSYTRHKTPAYQLSTKIPEDQAPCSTEAIPKPLIRLAFA